MPIVKNAPVDVTAKRTKPRNMRKSSQWKTRKLEQHSHTQTRHQPKGQRPVHRAGTKNYTDSSHRKTNHDDGHPKQSSATARKTPELIIHRKTLCSSGSSASRFGYRHPILRRSMQRPLNPMKNVEGYTQVTLSTQTPQWLSQLRFLLHPLQAANKQSILTKKGITFKRR